MPLIRINWWVAQKGNTYQDLDKPEGYGVSYFWFCIHCGERYAEAKIEGRIWHALSGCCLACSGDRWTISGTLESMPFVGWPVPETILRYQLAREIAFLDHPDHPHNQEHM